MLQESMRDLSAMRWVLTPNVLNTMRAGYKRYTYRIIPTDRTTIADLGANYTQPGHSFLPQAGSNESIHNWQFKFG